MKKQNNMRIKLTLSPSRETLPFDHLPVLTGTLHKWLGPNQEHGGLSLYSFSWLQGGKPVKNGLEFSKGATWYISALDAEFMMRSVQGIMSDPVMRWGMKVERAEILPPPRLPDHGEVRFTVASPVFVKYRMPDPDKPGEMRDHHYLYSDPESDALLTETLRHKLRAAGMSDEGVSVRFDRDYPNPQTKKATYRGIGLRCSICPVFVAGSKEQLEFAWNVGVGGSTGIGMGCLV